MMRKSPKSPRESKGEFVDESLSTGPAVDTPEVSRKVQGWARPVDKASVKDSGIDPGLRMAVQRVKISEKDFEDIKAALKDNFIDKINITSTSLDKKIKGSVDSILKGILGVYGPDHRHSTPEAIFIELFKIVSNPNFSQKEFGKTKFFNFVGSLLNKSEYADYIKSALDAQRGDKKNYSSILQDDAPAIQDTQIQWKLAEIASKNEEQPKPE